MSIVKSTVVAFAAAAIAGTIGLSDSASAAKKVSFEKAWKLCKAELDKDKVPQTTTSNERFIRGGACMKKYGYEF